MQAELRYDPLGRLYYLRDYVGPNGITRFAYDGDAMIAEYNNATTLLRRYVHGSNAEADDPLVWYEGTSVASSNARHLHADPRGSIVLVAGSAGQTIAINTYDEYGIPDSASGDDIATKGRFRYTGQAWLPELGMYYYKARVYSPTLGRFQQTDPIGYEDQFNLYAYVGNDPVNGVDPTGEKIAYAGTEEEKALLQGWTLEVAQSDPELGKIYEELESSDHLHIVMAVPVSAPIHNRPLEDPDAIGPPDNTRYIDGRGGGSISQVRTTSAFGKDGTTEYKPQAQIAHELFGHGKVKDSGTLGVGPEGYARDEANAERVEGIYRSSPSAQEEDKP